MSRDWGKIVCSGTSREAEMHVEGNNQHVLRCPDCGKSLKGLRTFDPDNWQDMRDSYSEVLHRWCMGEETEANLQAAQQEYQTRKEAHEADPENWIKQQMMELAAEKIEQILKRLRKT